MKKYLLILFITIVAFEKNAFAQTDSFDVFTYQPPEFFTKSELPSEVYFNMTNKAGSGGIYGMTRPFNTLFIL